MSRHDHAVSIQQMRDHAREASDLIKGVERASFEGDRVLQLATTRLLEIIGEAANRVSPTDRASYPQIPWHAVIGMRNRLIHGYDVVDVGVLWDTLTLDIPALVAVLDKCAER